MSTETLDLFTTAVKEVAAGPRVSDFQGLTKALLQRLAEKGVTLEECCDRRMLNRSLSTLQARCREFGIRFPDYTPSNMRKHVRFVPHGDELVLSGEDAGAVAAALGANIDGTDQCRIPAASFDGAREKLKAFGYVAKVEKPSKKRSKADA